jgi:hypothetical protein
MTKARERFFAAVDATFGEIDVISRKQIREVCDKNDIAKPAWLTHNPSYRAERGAYSLAAAKRDSGIPVRVGTKKVPQTASVPVVPAVQDAPSTTVEMSAAVLPFPQNDTPALTESLVPTKQSGYVPFGHFSDVRKIISSGKFYPMYITGLSGNGKTMMVEQVCAAEKRECIRVNITIETDEDDLLGGFRLINGQTVWQNGPVINAMLRGAVLLLDEVDLGSNRMMCLQPVLEGKPIFLKKVNKLIVPAHGFTIVATANTKGKGSEDGRFVGTNVMNEAFLERFSITLEQEYPSSKVEAKILNNILAASGSSNAAFVNQLVAWAEVIRKSFLEGAVPEIISTRRLVHICEAYAIFGREAKAIELCLNRFDVDTKRSFIDLYKKLDPTAPATDAPAGDAPAAAPTDQEYAF